MFRKKAAAFTLALLLAAPSFIGIAQAAADEQSKLTVQNDFVSVSVNKRNGRFSISTVKGSPLRDSDSDKPLLFEHKEPDTSFTTFRVNGKDYIYGNDYGFLGAKGYFTANPFNDGLINCSVWEVDGLEITQTLTLVMDKANPNVGNVKVAYSVHNTSSQEVSLGTRMLLDTMTGADDAAPITLAGSNTFIQRETEIKQVPAYWKAVDDPLAPKVMSYGLLSGWGNDTPDRMIIGHWSGLSETKWDYTVNPNLAFSSKNNPYQSADSAVALYWEPNALPAGETRSFETYYGLGSFYTSLKKAGYNLQLFSPEKLTLSSDRQGYEEDVFDIVAELDNSVDQAKPLQQVVATLNLPEELSFADGEKATQSAAAIAVGGQQSFRWRVKATPQTVYKASRYQLSIQAAGEEEVLRTRYVMLPALSGLPPQVQVQSLLPGKLYVKDDRKQVTLQGIGFEVLKGASDASVELVRSRDNRVYPVSSADWNVSSDNAFTVRLEAALRDGMRDGEQLETGEYKLVLRTASYGSFERTVELTNDPRYMSRSYGILLVTGSEQQYEIAAVSSEEELAQLKADGDRQILLEIRGKVREYGVDDTRYYEVEPGATLNEVLQFQTSDSMKELYGESTQVMTLRKKPRDIWHSGDYIDMIGNGILSIPSFPFSYGEFGIELTDGEAYSLTPDEDAGEQPVLVKWKALQGLQVVQQMDMFPVRIKDAAIGDKSVSFGGSLQLNLGNPKQAEQKLGGGGQQSGGTGGTGGTGGSGGSSGSSGGSSGGTGGQTPGGSGKDDEDDTTLGIRVDVDEARFGIRQKSDITGRAGTYGFMGLRAEGEAGLPKKLIPGMDLGAEGRVLIDTFDRKYEIEADVRFQIVELYGYFTLRFTDYNIPIPDNFVFSFGGEPGIPLVTPYIVAYITKGGGGFKNLYDTVMGNFYVLPPLKLVLIGGLDIAKVAKADNVTFELSMRGLEFSAELEILRMKILKEVYGSLLVDDPQNHLGASLKLGAKLEVFDVIKGEVYAAFTYDSSKSGIFGPISLVGGGNAGIFVPDWIPVFGGTEVAGASVEFGTERVYGQVRILGIPVAVQYVWGDSAVSLTALKNKAENFAGLGGKTSVDEETGEPTERVAFGTNIRKVADSSDRYASLETGLPSTAVATVDGTSHHILIRDQEMAIMEFRYQDEAPELEVRDPKGVKYDLKEGVNYRVQEIPADISQSGTVEKRAIVTVVNPEEGTWNVTSNVPVESTLYDVTVPPSVNGVTVAETGSNGSGAGREVQVGWTGDHLTDEKVALYVTADPEKDPGELLADGLDGKAGSAVVKLPESLATGDYYIQARVYKDGTTYGSATSSTSIPVRNRNQPDAPASVQATAGGNGLLKVDWTMDGEADGYYLQLLDEQGAPLQDAGPVEVVGGEQREAWIGGAFQRTCTEGVSDCKEGTAEGDALGMPTGRSYQVSMTAYKEVDGHKYFSTPARTTAAAYVPEPNPAELTMTLSPDGGSYREAYDETGKLYYIVNRPEAVVQLAADQVVTGSLQVNDADAALSSGQASSWEQRVSLQEGTNRLLFTGWNAQGDIAAKAIRIDVDTVAPELKLESPAGGVTEGTADRVNVRGVAEPGSQVIVDGLTIETSPEGHFATEVPVSGVMRRTMTIAAVDRAGNRNEFVTEVGAPALEGLQRVEIRRSQETSLSVSGSQTVSEAAPPEAGKLTVGASQAYELVGVNADGGEVVIDPAQVEWSMLAGDSYGSVDASGVLQSKSEGDIVLLASYRLSTDYAMQDAYRVTIEAAPAPGGGTSDDSSYDDWYQEPTVPDPDPEPGQDPDPVKDPDPVTDPAPDSDSDSGSEVAPEQEDPAAAAERMLQEQLRKLIELETNAEFLAGALLDGSKETQISFDGGSMLRFAPGSVQGQVGLGIGRLKDVSGYQSDRTKLLSPIYSFKLNQSVQPLKPVELRLKVSPQTAAMLASDPQAGALYWFNERKNRWEYVGGMYDAATQTLTAELPHFSLYALLRDDRLPRYADMAADRWSYGVVNRLASIGAVGGVERDGQPWFEPSRSITRQEFVKLLTGIGEMTMPSGPLPEAYRDRADAGAWAVPSLNAALERGWLEGSGSGEEKRLEPQRTVTRAEVAVIVSRLLQELQLQAPTGAAPAFTDKADFPKWAVSQVEELAARGILSGYPDGSFRPGESMTREEAATLISKVLDLLYAAGKELH